MVLESLSTLPTFVVNHAVWSVLIFLSFLAVYRKYSESPNDMLENFYKFFFAFSVPFFGLMTVMIGYGSIIQNEMLLTYGYLIPHIFAFVSIGYLWRVVASINFPQYSKGFWGFILLGLLIFGFGVYEQPEVVVQSGEVLLGPDSTFSALLPLGFALSAVLIAAGSFYAAYVSEGETRLKLVLISIALILQWIVSGTLQNLGYRMLGDAFNAVWILIYLIVTYWSETKSLVDRLR